MKLSFKKDDRPTGLAAIANPYPFTYIKGDKKKIGYIRPPSWRDNGWRVSLSVKKEETAEAPADFRWIQFKAVFSTEMKAREFVKKHWDNFQTKYDLYQFEND